MNMPTMPKLKTMPMQFFALVYNSSIVVQAANTSIFRHVTSCNWHTRMQPEVCMNAD